MFVNLDVFWTVSRFAHYVSKPRPLFTASLWHLYTRFFATTSVSYCNWEYNITAKPVYSQEVWDVHENVLQTL